MEFHTSKCFQITFYLKRQPSDQPLNLHNTRIPKTDINYQGVTLNTKNNWNMHVKNTAARGNSTLGFIKRDVLTTSENARQLHINNWFVQCSSTPLQLGILFLILLLNVLKLKNKGLPDFFVASEGLIGRRIPPVSSKG